MSVSSHEFDSLEFMAGAQGPVRKSQRVGHSILSCAPLIAIASISTNISGWARSLLRQPSETGRLFANQPEPCPWRFRQYR